MRLSNAVLVTAVLASSWAASGAQPTATTLPQPATVVLMAPTEILKPALDDVRTSLDGVKLDKWKKGTIRDEAGSNINTIQHDLQNTLPPLLATADAEPGKLSKVLPVTRNVDAVYDVLVHVVEASRVVAPGDQVGLLQQSLGKLERARVRLDEQVQHTAEAQEKQVTELRSTIQTQTAQLRAAATPPPAPACPAPAPAKKKKKPATTTAKKPETTTAPKPEANSTTTASPVTPATKPQ